jgi:hypothetical protein
MMKLFALFSLLFCLQACATNERSLLDRIEFDDDEIGCAEIRGVVDVNPIPLITSNASIVVKKIKKGPIGDTTPVPTC